MGGGRRGGVAGTRGVSNDRRPGDGDSLDTICSSEQLITWRVQRSPRRRVSTLGLSPCRNRSLRLFRGELHAEESAAWRPLDGDLESSDLCGVQAVCLGLFAQESEPLCGFLPFCVQMGGV